MIVANLATYPPRRETLFGVLKALSPQVDHINLVLNEYETAPDFISSFGNVNTIIPEHDTKDAGKFYCDVSDASYVFFVDDDLVYPSDYVEKSIDRIGSATIDSFLAGYHCSIYQKPRFSLGFKALKQFIRYNMKPVTIADHRSVSRFYEKVEHSLFVDQVATNAAIMRGKDVPPYDYMKTSQKFVDVRLAKWCFERGIPRICLPRSNGWLGSSSKVLGIAYDETIYKGFTRTHPTHVADEIYEFAFKTPNIGKLV